MSKPYAVKAYLSCPVSYSFSTLYKYGAYIETQGAEVSYWDRTATYSSKLLDDADIFILMFPNNNFLANINSLPKGCLKELARARDLHKEIYMMYCPSGQPEPRIYEVSISNGFISGMAGTTLGFPNYVNKLKAKSKISNDVHTETISLDFSFEKPDSALTKIEYGINFADIDKSVLGIVGSYPQLNAKLKISDRRLLFLQ